MNRSTRTVLLLASAALLGGVLVYAGPLNPPAGTVTPSYKTMTEVEPRTALTPLPAGVTISTPGAYYLTSGVTYTGTDAAIVIACEDVDLDLNGFTIRGQGQTGNSAVGIRGLPAGPNINITIRDGGIRYFGGNAVDFPSVSTTQALRLNVSRCGGLAVRFNGTNCRVEGCNLTQCNGGGVTLGSDAIVKNNNILSCGDGVGTGDGINIGAGYGAAEGNNVEYCSGNGIIAAFSSTVRNNTIRNANRSGIRVGADCLCEGNAIGQCNNGNFTTEAGIWVDNRASVRRNVLSNSFRYGIYVQGISGTILQDNHILNMNPGSAPPIYLNVSGSYLYDNKWVGTLQVGSGVTYTNGPGNTNY